MQRHQESCSRTYNLKLQCCRVFFFFNEGFYDLDFFFKEARGNRHQVHTHTYTWALTYYESVVH